MSFKRTFNKLIELLMLILIQLYISVGLAVNKDDKYFENDIASENINGPCENGRITKRRRKIHHG